MIPSTLRIVLIAALIFYFVMILIFLKNKTLELRYTLLWMFSGVILEAMKSLCFPTKKKSKQVYARVVKSDMVSLSAPDSA